MSTAAYLALGANLGDRLATMQRAVDALQATAGIRVLRSARVYETEPVGGPEGQPAFLDTVLAVETDLSPSELLASCLSIEDRLGRVRAERWGPRSIDIDVLTFGDRTVDEPDLQIPHPRMHERMFVLAPLLELDADPMLPGGRKAQTMRLSVLDPFGVRPVAPPLRVAEERVS